MWTMTQEDIMETDWYTYLYTSNHTNQWAINRCWRYSSQEVYTVPHSPAGLSHLKRGNLWAMLDMQAKAAEHLQTQFSFSFWILNNQIESGTHLLDTTASSHLRTHLQNASSGCKDAQTQCSLCTPPSSPFRCLFPLLTTTPSLLILPSLGLFFSNLNPAALSITVALPYPQNYKLHGIKEENPAIIICRHYETATVGGPCICDPSVRVRKVTVRGISKDGKQPNKMCEQWCKSRI